MRPTTGPLLHFLCLLVLVLDKTSVSFIVYACDEDQVRP